MPTTFDLMKTIEDVTTMEMLSTDVHTEALNFRLRGVTHIEGEPTRRARWALVASPGLRRAGLAGDLMAMLHRF